MKIDRLLWFSCVQRRETGNQRRGLCCFSNRWPLWCWLGSQLSSKHERWRLWCWLGSKLFGKHDNSDIPHDERSLGGAEDFKLFSKYTKNNIFWKHVFSATNGWHGQGCGMALFAFAKNFLHKITQQLKETF